MDSTGGDHQEGGRMYVCQSQRKPFFFFFNNFSPGEVRSLSKLQSSHVG